VNTRSLPEVLALHRAGQLDEAETGYRDLIAASGNADAMQLLASLLHQGGRSAEALGWLDRALPHLAQRDAAESNRAAILLALDRPDEAWATAERVLRRTPAHAGAQRNRAFALLAIARGHLDLVAASAAYARYAAARGDDALAFLEYGNVQQNIGAAEDAIASFERARMLAPQVPEVASAALIAAHFDRDADTAALAARARRAGALYAPVLPERAPVAGDRRCVGFYSPRFGDGPIASLILPVLRELAQRGVRLVLFAGFEHDDVESRAFRAVADAWHVVGAVDDAEFARRVSAERIGVLVDLCGHAPGNRLRAFAARLAPLQVSWGDWFCTTGVRAMDVFLGDPVSTPAQEDAEYSERVLRLPSTRFAYALPADAPAAASAPGEPCFASFNRLSKLTAATLAAWARILHACPGATLLLRSGGLEQASLQAHTRARFAAHGVAPERLRFEAFGSYADTLARYRDVTLALDPFPFNGCVTTLDALAMGVPVLALKGRSLVARQSAALLHALDCADWVADNVDGYVTLASRLLEPSAQADARARLKRARGAGPFAVGAFVDAWWAAVQQSIDAVDAAGSSSG
jgi:predicted O-linked N-acetylglucosamine transferase (SPINDLY family)